VEDSSQNAGKDNIREHLIQAARQVFMRYGYKKTALDDIAKEARKGKSTIYYYFKSKDDIFKAVIDTEAKIRSKSIEEQVSAVTDSQQKLKTYIYVRMLSLMKVVNYYEALKNEMLDNLYFINSLRINHFDTEVQIIKGLLQEGIDKQIYIIENSELTARTIVTLLQGFEVPVIKKNLSDEEIQRSIDEMLNILFHGIVSK
jgi:AcrR family transcriptional regulator